MEDQPSEDQPAEEAPQSPKQRTRKVRKEKVVVPPEPPPPLDAMFFGDLFRTQRRLEQERRAERLSNLRFT